MNVGFGTVAVQCAVSFLGICTSNFRYSVFTAAEGKTDEDRIVGGYTAAENKPWVAKVFLKKFNSICGGTLINKRYNSLECFVYRTQTFLKMITSHNHRVDRVPSFFLQSSELGLPPPPVGECASPPLFVWGRWGTHSLGGKGVGESQFRRGDRQTLWYSWYICTL